MKKSVVRIGNVELLTEVAITDLQHQKGLMNQINPPVMSFIFNTAEKRAFWMHSTPHPLWICFCREGKVTDVMLGIPNSTEHLVGIADLVVEIPVGQNQPLIGDDVSLILNASAAEVWLDRYLLNL